MKKVCELKGRDKKAKTAGDLVRLAGTLWEAEVVEKPRGKEPTTVMCDVYGMYHEMGSVYAHDIVAVKDADGNWEKIEHTPKQLKCKQMNEALFG